MRQSNKVYIVDDDPVICEATQMLLSMVGFDARTYDSAPAFLEHAELSSGGCVVADVRMPEMTGIELAEKLKQFPGAPRVILMTADSDLSLVIEAMRAGAVDFLEKPFNPDHLIESVRQVLADGEGKEARIAKREAFIGWLNTLDDTEKKVLGHVIAGRTNKDIAVDLAVNPSTLDLYRANAMSKMNVRSLAELVRMWFLAGRDAFPGVAQT